MLINLAFVHQVWNKGVDSPFGDESIPVRRQRDVEKGPSCPLNTHRLAVHIQAPRELVRDELWELRRGDGMM